MCLQTKPCNVANCLQFGVTKVCTSSAQNNKTLNSVSVRYDILRLIICLAQ